MSKVNKPRCQFRIQSRGCTAWRPCQCSAGYGDSNQYCWTHARIVKEVEDGGKPGPFKRKPEGGIPEG